MCTWLPQEFLLHPCLFAMLQSLASAQIQARECTCPIPLMKRYLVTQESGNNNCEDLFFFVKSNWAKLSMWMMLAFSAPATRPVEKTA